ncbi:MAG: hypothetical protein PHV77_02480 [Candidatus Omnitrophica bacterium]|jgi:hypothetical protein|nr:hypothetical protein [Candidatus Omnitrophota bacterium]
MIKTTGIAISLCLAACLLNVGICLGQDTNSETLAQYIDGKYVRLIVGADVNKEKTFRRIASSGDSLFGLFGSSKPYTDKGFADEFDSLFLKACRILDMYPRNVKIDIRILKNQKQLNDNLVRIGKKIEGQELVSYYIHALKTIYTCESTIARGIMAHELGHVITEHYFITKVPYQVGELMAQHVETSIDE